MRSLMSWTCTLETLAFPEGVNGQELLQRNWKRHRASEENSCHRMPKVWLRWNESGTLAVPGDQTRKTWRFRQIVLDVAVIWQKSSLRLQRIIQDVQRLVCFTQTFWRKRQLRNQLLVAQYIKNDTGCNWQFYTGWWFNPLKNISQLGWLFLIYGKTKNVPNHQPV